VTFTLLSVICCSVVEGLTRLLARAQQIQTCYKKYCISTDVLNATFSQVDSALAALDTTGSADDITTHINSLADCQENLKRRHSCLNTMHEQVAEIEALTLCIGEFDVESVDRK